MSAATAAPIPVGSRVVLVEDHRGSRMWGAKGWRGVVTTIDPSYERIHTGGRYCIDFDNGETWYVNASAVALETPPDTLTPWERDTALAMALTLARLLDHDCHDPGSHSRQNWMPGKGLVSDWLRDCVRRDLERES